MNALLFVAVGVPVWVILGVGVTWVFHRVMCYGVVLDEVGDDVAVRPAASPSIAATQTGSWLAR